ncbi:hypothetical protein [Bosea sp. (in: a-proteobacteria)]|uniref:hypothetical protein n=1 Tax=Bosea sp. (in: a-proteobacteria) TaxID=1871050 RepID=UPI0025BC8169|nr:hypothetical protein [Bosea sp. (in: a-proteobacteria)]
MAIDGGHIEAGAHGVGGLSRRQGRHIVSFLIFTSIAIFCFVMRKRLLYLPDVIEILLGGLFALIAGASLISMPQQSVGLRIGSSLLAMPFVLIGALIFTVYIGHMLGFVRY